MDIQNKLKKAGIDPEPLKDQFFLINEEIIRKMVDLAQVNESDVVLEIGAGVGNLTREIAKRANKVIAVEIDKRFAPFLDDLPKNVEVHYEDAHKYASQGGKFRKKKEYNKVVSNLPYSMMEWLLHNLAFVEYDKAVLMVAKKFFYKIEKNPVFGSFYKTTNLIEVDKSNFYPEPKANSVLVDLIKLEDPIKTRDLGLFLRQYIYQKEEWKTKNSIREGLIIYTRSVFKKQLTKNQAKKIIKETGTDGELLEKDAHNSEIFMKVTDDFNEKLLKKNLSSN